jgi:hypothetical protein
MSMTDPPAALVSLQVEVRKGMPTHPAENYQSVRVVADKKMVVLGTPMPGSSMAESFSPARCPPG